MVPGGAAAEARQFVLYTHGPQSCVMCGVTPPVPLPGHIPPGSHPLTPWVSAFDPLGFPMVSLGVPWRMGKRPGWLHGE